MTDAETTTNVPPVPPTAPPREVPPEGEPIPNEDFGPLAHLSTFPIRNGDPADARSLLVKATIPAKWYWQPIEDLPVKEAIKNTPAYIKQAYARLMTHKVKDDSQEMIRQQAILLGVARAVTTELYQIETADLIPGEVATSVFVAKGTSPADRVISIKAGVPAAEAEMLRTPLDLTEKEKEVVAAAHMSAIGLLPLQGYSLVMTSHHYLSEGDNQSKRAFNVLERQYWTGGKLNEWWAPHEKAMRDALWHKACHPVNLSLKRQVAQNELTPKMLEAAGAGPAAARLPAVEPEVRRALSYKTLVKTVRPLFESYGGELDFGLLLDAIDVVKLFPPESDREPPGRPSDLGPSIPRSVTTRSRALEYLKDVCERNSDLVAYCYGFYCQLSEQTAMAGAGGGTDTLKSSYSLRSLKSQSYASWVQGTQAYGDYMAARNQARAAGKFVPPKLIFA